MRQPFATEDSEVPHKIRKNRDTTGRRVERSVPMENMKEKEVGSSFHDNLAWMDQHLPVEASFDLIKREIEIGGRNAAFYFIDGFMKEDVYKRQVSGRMER